MLHAASLSDFAVILAIAIGIGALIGHLRARRHHHLRYKRLACPRSGAPVDCVLHWDPRSREFRGVAHCSGRTGGCPETCSDLLNLGVPLRARKHRSL